MKKKMILSSIGLGIAAAGAGYLAKKTGFFEDDAWLYDEYDSTLN
ncbi:MULTISPECIES: hypothetical protein [Enterococcaceae]|uniref:Methanol dehydrogenase n=3 Tax=Tetragenococcus TaxID=51668 RepID=A0AAN1SJ96_TETHN|nr:MULTISPECIES: hypothetical protein [Enterococcaceae]AOF48227.1 methanol dehydrogenase [Tetragenococcus halophilus]MCF1601126.1 methanol dehydrogenase [Tetragenococcus halophilus]MCF1675326.1 methanol dehydrogenase [Tetragenococcus halophilus]MCF1685010.1 methanol dehydrogenase [Tetragenococcus halophilus]MCO7027656.1 methanol dehydrogenase [Tetragenococcus halophilus]